MRRTECHILAYLPSPMGDAILCTPALRAVRQHFNTGRISFLARPTIRETLSPCPFTDEWLELSGDHPLAIARQLSKHKFTHALLFKNSFGSALATCLAGVPSRIGYRREGRGFLLTERLSPVRSPGGGYEPVSMVDYYLAIASRLGADTTNRDLELHVDPQAVETVRTKVPEVFETNRPVVILVPGGAFGPSKCWPSENFAQTADWLINSYGATVVLSVTSNDFERRIAKDIEDASRHTLVSLAERPVDIGELKALFSRADLVISNDTGPRHIAIALQRKVITLFGPNDPAWTDAGYRNEVQIVSQAPCAPCQKPKCRKKDQVCMRDITPAQVCEAAQGLLHTDD